MTSSRDGRGPQSSRDPVLVARSLSKRYGRIEAVHSLDLDVYPGEVFGFLGPNGSGKSTTIGMALGLIRPSSGQIHVFGLDLRTHYWDIIRRIGAIIEAPALFPYLTGWENLRALAIAIGGISDRKIDDVLRLVDLTARKDDPFKAYSLGMRQRLGIASTLLRDPELIILDEPTNGLDPAGTKEIRDLIPRLAGEGRTVIVSSHLLHEIEQICYRVAILKSGRLLAQGPVDELLQRSRGVMVRVGDQAAAIAALRRLPGSPEIRESGPYLQLDIPVDMAPLVTEVLARKEIYLSELRPLEMSLERYFLEITEEGTDAPTSSI